MKTRIGLVLSLALIFVIIIGLLWSLGVRPQPVLLDPPMWKHITVGRTREADVAAYLGAPDQIEWRDSYLAYVYARPAEFDWDRVEVWLQQRESDLVVAGIFKRGHLTAPERGNRLRDLGLRCERPSEVMWSPYPGYRYLIWARQGIALSLRATRSFACDMPTHEVLLFEPQSLQGFLRTRWPWPTGVPFASGWASENWSLRTDHPDTLPEDPYDWRDIPSPELDWFDWLP